MALQLLLVVVVASGLWVAAPAAADRQLTVTLAAIVGVGIVGLIGAPSGATRLADPAHAREA